MEETNANNETLWYVAHTRPRCEKKIVEYCRREGLPTTLPLYKSVKKYRGKVLTFHSAAVCGPRTRVFRCLRLFLPSGERWRKGGGRIKGLAWNRLCRGGWRVGKFKAQRTKLKGMAKLHTRRT